LKPIYFTTESILYWLPLLNEDSYKDVVISSFKYLVDNKRLIVYGFVIRPTHMHVIWKDIQPENLKESASGSFFKNTAHEFQNKIRKEKPELLKSFYVGSRDRKYQFWQSNHHSKEIYSKTFFDQKLNYIHNNPIQEKWKLADTPVNYKYSSCCFYETNDDFGFLSNYYFE